MTWLITLAIVYSIIAAMVFLFTLAYMSLGKRPKRWPARLLDALWYGLWWIVYLAWLVWRLFR